MVGTDKYEVAESENVREKSRAMGESGAEVVGEREPREGGGKESATLRCVKKGCYGPP